MTWEIAFVFALLVIALACFVWEKFPPDLTAMGLLVIIVATGLLPIEKAYSVFANPAPLVHSAWLTAAVFSVANAAVLRVRIGWENRALGYAA